MFRNSLIASFVAIASLVITLAALGVQTNAALNTSCVFPGVEITSGEWGTAGLTIDNDFDTSTAPPGSAGAYGYMFANYSINSSINLTASIWEVKDSARVNLSLLANCSMVDDKLLVEARARAPAGYFTAWLCYNTTQGKFIPLRNDTSNNVMAEQCMWFDYIETTSTTTTSAPTTTTTAFNYTTHCSLPLNETGQCCAADNLLWTQDYYGANGTYYVRNETFHCDYGCDTNLNQCKPAPIIVYGGLFIIGFIVIWGLKKLRFW